MNLMPEQAIELVQRTLKVPTEHVSGTDFCCKIVSEYDIYTRTLQPSCAEVDDKFLEIDDEQRRFVLFHEKGHLIAYTQRLKGHMVSLRYLDAGIELPDDLYYMRECEADLYAAQQVGIKNAIKILAFTIPSEKERRERMRCLIDAWKQGDYDGCV